MKRGRSTTGPTKEQEERFRAIKEIGCVVARIRGLGFVPCDVHHLTTGGKHGQKRLGHDKTVGLNPWSHRGDWSQVATGPALALASFGPSYALNPRMFRELYPDALLLETQDKLIEQWRHGLLQGSEVILWREV